MADDAGQAANVTAMVALTLAVAALLVLVLFDVTAVAVARRQATTAAENAALAAATDASPVTPGDPSRTADWVAITNAARLERCECRRAPVVVTVSVEVRAPLLNRLGLHRVTATATADLVPTRPNGQSLGRNRADSHRNFLVVHSLRPLSGPTGSVTVLSRSREPPHAARAPRRAP